MGEWWNGGLGNVPGRQWRDRLMVRVKHVGRDGDGVARSNATMGAVKVRSAVLSAKW